MQNENQRNPKKNKQKENIMEESHDECNRNTKAMWYEASMSSSHTTIV